MVFKQCSKQGPTVLLGDFNARVGKTTSKAEATCAGKYALLPEENLPSKFSEDVRTNRELFIDFCLQHSLIATNTQYSKLPKYLYTLYCQDMKKMPFIKQHTSKLITY